MNLLPKLLAPYIAVGVFWYGLQNAWLTILAYHVQILLWLRPASLPKLRPLQARAFLFALPMALVGPALYFLLPVMTDVDIFAWLAVRRMSRGAFLLMTPYFGLLHPWLEQAHWGPLRRRTPFAHPIFAGYHVLVLSSLLGVAWLVLCFAALTIASLLWRLMDIRTKSPGVSIASHILADMGVVAATWLRG